MTNFSRLWNGTEPGWVVWRHTEDREHLTIAFSASGATIEEIKAIRAVIPEIASLPISKAMQKLRNVREYAIGEFESSDAYILKRKCSLVGLQVSSQGFQKVSHLLYNEITRSGLLIECPIENDKVVQEAIKNGLPIREATC